MRVLEHSDKNMRGGTAWTKWYLLVAWEKTGEIVGNNLVKGSRCLVEGRLQIRSYEAKDGQKRRIAEVVAQSVEFLDSKRHSDPETEDSIRSFGKDVFPDEEVPF